MTDHNNGFEQVDRTLEELGQRAWRTPSLEQITRKEFTMNTNRKTMTRTKLAMLVGGIAIIGAGSAFGAAYAMGAFKGKIVAEDGSVYDVELNQIGNGVYGGTTSEGHEVRFITEEAAGGEARMEMYLEAPESGEYTFSVDPEDLQKRWTAEDCEDGEIVGDSIDPK